VFQSNIVQLSQRRDVIERTAFSHTVGTLSSAMGAAFQGVARQFLPPLGKSDSIGLTVMDPTHRGLIFSAMVNEVTTLSARQVTLWSRVAAHLAAGLRTRRQLATLDGMFESGLDLCVGRAAPGLDRSFR